MGEMADLFIDMWDGDYGYLQDSTERLANKVQHYDEGHLTALLSYFETRGMTEEHSIVAEELRKRMDNMSELFEDL